MKNWSRFLITDVFSPSILPSILSALTKNNTGIGVIFILFILKIYSIFPLKLTDDSPDSSPVISKKRKVIDSAVEKKEDKNEAVQIIDCDEKEEDWLPPSPKISAHTSNLVEDSTIKEIRLKKKELASFAQSAKDGLRDVEESVKRDLSASLHSLQDSVAEMPSKPSTERAKMVISIQDKSGTKQFRIYADGKFERLFKLFADKVKLELQNLVFCFDGDKINPNATPSSLGMEDDDIIEVHEKPIC